MKTIDLAATLAALLAVAPALAHHSRANFDLDSTVEIEGTVTEFTWQNPHAFAVVEGKKAGSADVQKWTFELNSTPVLTRFGWKADTLKAGDHVVARGNPDRNVDRHFVYANLFVRDGKEIWAWGGPQLTNPAQPSPEALAAKSTDFTGVWRVRFRGDVLGRNAARRAQAREHAARHREGPGAGRQVQPGREPRVGLPAANDARDLGLPVPVRDHAAELRTRS